MESLESVEISASSASENYSRNRRIAEASQMARSDTERIPAHEEDECLLCAPAPHPNCEVYAVVEYLNREHVPLGEDDIDHAVGIPVCIEHYDALEKYRKGSNVKELSP